MNHSAVGQTWPASQRCLGELGCVVLLTDVGHEKRLQFVSACVIEKLSRLLIGQVTESAAHPGFNRTEMTAKYKEIWDIEGAVEPSVGAKRVLYEAMQSTLENTGKFVNAEDGLMIPW